MAGRLNALLGEQAYPNKVRGVWGKAVAGERYIALTIVTARCAHLDNDPLRRASNQLVIGSHTKMQWPNAISLECELSSTSFRFAYLMADHINRLAGFAWPALTRHADKICLSNKSTYQAVRELESAD